MPTRSLQLVLHYDGGGFAGWQIQPRQRTVQGVMQDALRRLCGADVRALGAGRTDAGVHALGQAVGVVVADRWQPLEMRRALNAVLPEDVWVKAAFLMKDEFHARYSAVSRNYRYLVGTDEEAESPFRRGRELAWRQPLEPGALSDMSAQLRGMHSFRAFAVKGTAPERDEHRCMVFDAQWSERAGGWAFSISANRFLHHMVRLLVGTMLEIASGRREPATLGRLLSSGDNMDTSPPAPPHGLYLEKVTYPDDLYLAGT